MKQSIIKIIYSIAFVTTSLILHAQDTNVPDPLSALSEMQLENLTREFGSSAIKVARSETVAHLMLDPYTSVKMGKLLADYNDDKKDLKLSGKTGTEYNREKNIMKHYFHSQLISLIGEEKFTQWQHYIEYKTERKYMREYGFSSDQIATYSHEAFKATRSPEITNLELSPELAIMMGELVVSYKSERARIKNSGKTWEDIKSALKLLSESHEKNIRILIGEDKYNLWKTYFDDGPRRAFAKKHGLHIEQLAEYNIDIIKMANCQEINHLSLPPFEALEMAEIKIAYQKAVKEIAEEDPERKSKRRELKKEYHSCIKQLLGDEKFAKWIEYQNHALERKYTKLYGFTQDQFKIYQDLENRQAVTILRIKSFAMPKDEKRRRIQEAKEEKIESLRRCLPAEQFGRWHKAYLEKETKKKASKQ